MFSYLPLDVNLSWLILYLFHRKIGWIQKQCRKECVFCKWMGNNRWRGKGKNGSRGYSHKWESWEWNDGRRKDERNKATQKETAETGLYLQNSENMQPFQSIKHRNNQAFPGEAGLEPMAGQNPCKNILWGLFLVLMFFIKVYIWKTERIFKFLSVTARWKLRGLLNLHLFLNFYPFKQMLGLFFSCQNSSKHNT